ncbi:hypothetical protein EVAR_42873_1 [Eumeta japonica]|uniref:Protein phosphatase 1 regulatory subunit 21 C-terminal domain-containing protein n=1 Tax=Eumeta variegata TaxID=151549 RepID=A0A4C1YH28_EUMVA|nr:hypothetical protein EVAR_42873_1 [Eumeta japonica]
MSNAGHAEAPRVSRRASGRVFARHATGSHLSRRLLQTYFLMTTVLWVCRLEEELQSTARNYEQQLGALSEHVAALSEKLAHQHDTAQRLQHQLRRK